MSERTGYSVSPVAVLMSVSLDQLTSRAEREALGEYQRLTYFKRWREQLLSDKRHELLKLRSEGKEKSDEYKAGEGEATALVKEINSLDKQILDLQEGECLKNLYKKLCEQAKAEGRVGVRVGPTPEKMAYERRVLIAEKERLKQEKLAEVRERIDADETCLSIVKFIAVVLVAILVFGSSWMAENWFAYERTELQEIEEPYEYVVDRIQTYVCYVTRTGECYHEGSCGYLKSKIETTVYEAKQRGYRACSRCEVTERTTLEIKETRYKTVTKTVTETVEPKWPVFLGGSGIVAVFYFVTAIPAKKRVEEAQRELKEYEKNPL